MNIGLVTGSFLPKTGGRELVVHHLATALTRRGHNVVVAALRMKRSDNKGTQSYIVKHIGFKGSYKLRMTTPLAVLTIAYITKKYNLELINVHDVNNPGNWVYYYSKYHKQIPVIGTPHGGDVQQYSRLNHGETLVKAIKKRVQRNIKSFNCITAVSKCMLNDLKEMLNDHATIRRVPNGVWNANFQKDIDREKVRRKYGIPLEHSILIAVGNNRPIKDYRVGIDALLLLLKNGYKVSYVLAGSGMASLRERAKDIGVSENFISTGSLSQMEVEYLLLASDIFINTSHMESFGLTTLEAMSAGLPCVVTDIPANRELVSTEIGAFFQPGNSSQLAQSVKYLLDKKMEWPMIGQRAIKIAKMYDWMKVVKEYEEVYLEVIHGHKK